MRAGRGDRGAPADRHVGPDFVIDPRAERAGVEDHCGVLAIAAKQPVAPLIYFALRALQHRGQESAGIAVHAPEGGVRAMRGMGLVHEVFTEQALRDLPGEAGIGHVRYATTGQSRIDNSQPVIASCALGDVALGHNGDIVNATPLRATLERSGQGMITQTDTEVLVRLFAAELTAHQSVERALRRVAARVNGAYCLAVLVEGTVIAIRDPLGIKPLVLGELPNGGGFVAASETVALDTLGAQFVRDVKPGEAVVLTPEAVTSLTIGAANRPAHCMFEWVYFARPDSIIEGREVYATRLEIGRRLAKEAPVDADVVVPIPDSGRTHALGYAQVSGVPLAEGLIKNRYVGRTFIMPDQQMRDLHVRIKLNAIPSIIRGKRVVLIDDSVIRGTTMKRIVDHVRHAGAREVHVRIGCPPVVAPCYLGIDMKSRLQFIANGRTTAEIAEVIGADTLHYLSIEGLVECIGMAKDDLCLGCITAEYPVEIPGERYRFQRTLPIEQPPAGLDPR
ncbi:MAG TPA: amidophosphoribosyltransferase [Candidatus Thermoplasmatota archaeon]